MTKLLLSIHVLAAIVAIGPVTVAASMFPAATRRALAEPSAPRGPALLRHLHRTCRVYAVLGVVVPVFGLATARSLGVLGDAWLIVSMVLTGAAAAVLILLVLPGQAEILRENRPAAGAVAGPVSHDPGSAGPGLLAQPDGSRARGEVAGSPGRATREGRPAARLGLVTGIFNLLWAVVVVLMIVRPGSTTGA